MDVRLPDGTLIRDVPEGTTKEQLRQKLARNGYDVRQLDAADVDPRKGMGVFEKIAVGAGAATDRAIRGIKGLVGMEDTQGAEDAALYQKYHPGGWATAGEVGADIAMMAVPSMKIGQAAAGLGAAGRVAANVAGNAGLSAAIAPEDRGLAAVGGGVGAGLGMALGKVLPLATASGRAALQERRAGRVLVSDIAGKRASASEGRAAAGSAADEMEAYLAGRSGVTKDVPLTTAQTLRQTEGANPLARSIALARRHLSVAGENADEFGQLARTQNAALHDALGLAAKDAGGLESAKLARKAVTDPMRDTAFQQAGQADDLAAPLRNHLDTVLSKVLPGGPTSKLAERVKSLISKDPTPENLYELKHVLTDELYAPNVPGIDEFTALTKKRQSDVVQITKLIDNILDNASASGGAAPNTWKPYLATYADMSKPVNSARAQQAILANVNEAVLPPTVGETPQLTRNVLKNAMLRGKANDTRFGSDNLMPAARERFDDIGQFMQRNEEVVRSMKDAGSMNGGSQTALQGGAMGDFGPSLAGLAANLAGAPHAGPIIGVSRATVRLLTGNLKAEVARMMLNPEAAIKGIRAALAAGRELSPAQQAFRVTMAGAGSAVAQPNEM